MHLRVNAASYEYHGGTSYRVPEFHNQIFSDSVPMEVEITRSQRSPLRLPLAA